MEEDRIPIKEPLRPSTEVIADAVVKQSRWKRVLSRDFWGGVKDKAVAIATDSQVHEGVAATGRTLINVGLSVGEFVPVAGEIATLGVDALKAINRTAKLAGVDLHLDTTPDVSLWVALGSEIPDLALTGGTLPSHALETGLQIKHDIPRIRDAVGQVKSILKGESEDYIANQAPIDQAMRTFDVEPPSGT